MRIFSSHWALLPRSDPREDMAADQARVHASHPRVI